MTGFDSKRNAARDKLDNDDDDIQVYSDTLTIVYQRGFADGKRAANAMHELARLGQEIEQKPVISAWGTREVYFDDDGEPIMHRSPPAAQRPWVGLTDEEIQELRLKTFDAIATNYEIYRAIEAKLKEKNGH